VITELSLATRPMRDFWRPLAIQAFVVHAALVLGAGSGVGSATGAGAEAGVTTAPALPCEAQPDRVAMAASAVDAINADAYFIAAPLPQRGVSG
jgi:hypothetical protein